MTVRAKSPRPCEPRNGGRGNTETDGGHRERISGGGVKRWVGKWGGAVCCLNNGGLNYPAVKKRENRERNFEEMNKRRSIRLRVDMSK